ncbi:PAN domain-containing protein [Hyphomonas sp.]|uniref:PAN domain-containing protein n=1 Tax=Hyphomonas sp. TaxID=87 RepID=UPI001BD0A84B|nr:PAN domain-containing protein [Hyphomonas sp.]
MRFAILIAAACLGFAASALADGKEGKTMSVPPISPLEATGTEAMYEETALPAGHERDVYRFGATYNVVESSSALACEAACDDEMSCRSWSFVDTYGASPARCELKRGQGKKEENRLATSGIANRLRTAALGEMPQPAVAPASDPGQLDGGLAQADTSEAAVETADAGVTPAPAPSSP